MTISGAVRSAASARLAAAAALLAALGASLLAAPVPAAARAAQAAPAAPQYADAAAARLHAAAMAARERQERSVLAYRAVVRQRLAVALRAPLKDRTLYRAETAQRVLWGQDGCMLVQILGLREQTPSGVSEEDLEYDLADTWFDPLGDRLLFGLSDDDEDDAGAPACGDADASDPDADDANDAADAPVADTSDANDAEDAAAARGDRRRGDRGRRDGRRDDRDEDDGFDFLHPLVREQAGGYRFESGDTLTLSLPDGRSIQAVELRVIPRVADPRRIAGTLWIEPRTGALVRAVWRLSETLDLLRDIPDLRADDERGEFRLVPGLFKPWTFELRVVAVEYSLWDLEVWMPRSLRVEGTAAAGILKAPVAFDVSYEMESVTTPRSLAEDRPEDRPPELALPTRADTLAWLERLAFGGAVPYARNPAVVRRDGDRRVSFLIPEDPAFLARSPALPPPVWDDAPGFATSDEIDGFVESLAQLPQTRLASVPWTVRWGPQRPDLVRYNRVEALSLGLRAQVRPPTPLGPVSLTGTVRLGVGDLVPNVSLEATRETIERRITLSAYHELASIDERARHLGIGNSVIAATVGRDDGDYYRRSGAMLEWTPPVSVRRTFRVRAWAEHQEGVEAETDFALFRIGSDAFAFRPNLDAADVWEYGASLELSPWWGTDPNLAQGGLDAYLQGAVGDAEYARASLTGRLVVPLAARLRLGLEAGGGTTWGAPTPQRLWYVGGPMTLRGYEPRIAGGRSFARARVELARAFSFGRISLFSDAAWAGARGDVDLDDALRSIGIGYSILDGLIRFDAAWGIDAPEDFRLEAYLDQIL